MAAALPISHNHNQNHSQTPLLNSHQNNNHRTEEEEDTELEQTLQSLYTFLSFLGFRQCSKLSFSLSWTGFFLVGILVPVLVLELSDCSGCNKYQITHFELQIVLSQVCLAAASLACLAHNLRKYGIRKFLFVDRYNGQMSRFHDHYIHQIRVSMRLLVLWSLPCFILKLVREIIRISYVHHESQWTSVAILLALTVSWTYLSAISLSASIIFHLICNLQVIHFDDYAKLLESESDVLILMEEHIRLRYHLSKISHRFRIYLILVFLVVTISQFATLFQTTGFSEMLTVTNSGDFAVSALVQVVGISICLHAATRITHRAQGIGSLASRWHASITLTSTETSHVRHSNSNSSANLEAANQLNSIHLDYSESDLESLDYGYMPTNIQLASYMSCYQKRHAFCFSTVFSSEATPYAKRCDGNINQVLRAFLLLICIVLLTRLLPILMYVQNNPGGITLYGCTVDRGLINAIFFMQLTLITFVLGKTLVLSSTSSDSLGAIISA